jgi:acyl-CoA synthetase (NDP forming)
VVGDRPGDGRHPSVSRVVRQSAEVHQPRAPNRQGEADRRGEKRAHGGRPGAASSHTGALAGEDSAVDALFAQTGVIRTDTIEELFDMSMLLANQPVPASNRLAIVTNAGGPGIMATDACESRGLVVTPLSEATMEKLRGFLPSEASVKNPVDMIASASAESYGKAVRVLLEDPQVDSLLVIFVPPIITEAPAVAAAVREALATTPAAKEKAILACFLGTRGVPESLVTLQAGKVPSYAFPEAAAIAFSRAVDYGKWKRLPEPVFPQFRVEKDRAAKAISGAREKAISSFWLDASGVHDVLGAYGICMPQTASAKTADDAARLAKQFGVPVAVKLESRTLTHKTEVGGVKLNVKDAAAQQAFYVVGVSLDPAFGHLLMYGLGGVAVEILKDVAWGVAPIADVDADRMIGSVKGSKMLAGFRGAPPADIPALKDVMLRVSQLVCDFPEIEEMDLNPVRVLPVGRDRGGRADQARGAEKAAERARGLPRRARSCCDATAFTIEPGLKTPPRPVVGTNPESEPSGQSRPTGSLSFRAPHRHRHRRAGLARGRAQAGARGTRLRGPLCLANRMSDRPRRPALGRDPGVRGGAAGRSVRARSTGREPGTGDPEARCAAHPQDTRGDGLQRRTRHRAHGGQVDDQRAPEAVGRPDARDLGV